MHIITRLLRAGSEENTLLTCRSQLEQGHDVFVVHGHDSLPAHASALAPGATVLELPALTREVSPLKDATAFAQARRLLKRLSPDVVHTHQSKAGIVGRFAAAAADVPLIVHGVHILPFVGVGAAKRAGYLVAERAAARVTDAFIHVSDGLRTECLDNGVGIDRPHHVVRSGFDIRRFAEAPVPSDRSELLRLDGHQNEAPLVVAMLAALEPRKNHLALLEHLPPLLKRFPGLRFVFAGEGHMRERIVARIAELQMSDRIVLTGFRDDPERIIAMSDVCVHCSDREGLPRSVLQYLAGGRAVVLFRLPGIEEVIGDRRNGIIVAHGDWTAFLVAVGNLLENAEARAALSRGARHTDLSGWDSALMGDATLAIYRKHARSDQSMSQVA